MTDTLATKYRPTFFKDVIGQAAIVKSLDTLIERRSNRTFLFHGPSGTGKTTLARICALEVGCRPQDITEIDAATNTGIDDMRSVTSGLAYKALPGVKARALIVDEAHGLSAKAWDSLLKVLEEPPKDVYWFLCTTLPTKVPATVKTRCIAYELKPVPSTMMVPWLLSIAKKEKLAQGADGEGIVELCCKEANGSPRQALNNLGTAGAAKTRAEAADLLKAAGDSPGAIDLARLLIKGAPWDAVQPILAGMKDTNPESIRHVVRAYVTTVTLGTKDGKQAARCMELLQAFSEPCNSSDGISPIVLACGRALF